MAELPQIQKKCFRAEAGRPKGASRLMMHILLVVLVAAFAATDVEAGHFVTTANKTLPKKKALSGQTAVKRTSKAKRAYRAPQRRKHGAAEEQLGPGISLLRAEDWTQVRSELEKYVGTRYKRGGTGREGFDCSGFSRSMYLKLFGIDLPHNARQQFYSSQFTRRSIPSLGIGDLVFFSPTGKKNRINHVGIYLEDGRFIHASSKRGITISSIDKKYWRRRLVSAKSLAHKKLLTRQSMPQYKPGGEESQGIAAAVSRFQVCSSLSP